ncbi:MAG: heterodisulfide reductase-related iron-sulfur binding cluster, partial [Desulfobacteria bacterium]
LLGTNDELSLDFAEKKLDSANKAGAHYMATACVFCQIQFDTVQKSMESARGSNHHVPSILYPQLLGLCMDIDRDALGLESNQIDITEVENFLTTNGPGLKSA